MSKYTQSQNSNNKQVSPINPISPTSHTLVQPANFSLEVGIVQPNHNYSEDIEAANQINNQLKGCGYEFYTIWLYVILVAAFIGAAMTIYSILDQPTNLVIVSVLFIIVLLWLITECTLEILAIRTQSYLTAIVALTLMILKTIVLAGALGVCAHETRGFDEWLKSLVHPCEGLECLNIFFVGVIVFGVAFLLHVLTILIGAIFAWRVTRKRSLLYKKINTQNGTIYGI